MTSRRATSPPHHSLATDHRRFGYLYIFQGGVGGRTTRERIVPPDQALSWTRAPRRGPVDVAIYPRRGWAACGVGCPAVVARGLPL